MQDLARRAASGFPLAFFLLALIVLAPDGVLVAAAALVALLAIDEWGGMAGVARKLSWSVQAVVLLAVWGFLRWVPQGELWLLLSVGLFWAYAVLALMRIESRAALPERLPLMARFGAGVFVCGGFFCAIVASLQVQPGHLGWNLPDSWLGIPFARFFLVAVLTSIAFADMGAYFVGQRWGRRRISPVVSGGKTIEGFFGSLAAGLLVPAPLILWLPFAQWFVSMLAMTALIALSLFGDLWESLRKRYSRVKDSGSLLAGHGGILDRIDSHLLALPLLLLLLQLLNWPL